MHSQYIGTECHNAKNDGGIHEVARPPALKVKDVDLYSTVIVVPRTQCYLQITPYLPLSRKHSPDGASPD